MLTLMSLLSWGPHRGDSELLFKIPVSCNIDQNISRHFPLWDLNQPELFFPATTSFAND